MIIKHEQVATELNYIWVICVCALYKLQECSRSSCHQNMFQQVWASSSSPIMSQHSDEIVLVYVTAISTEASMLHRSPLWRMCPILTTITENGVVDILRVWRWCGGRGLWNWLYACCAAYLECGSWLQKDETWLQSKAVKFLLAPLHASHPLVA